jgi:hypothetical protein
MPVSVLFPTSGCARLVSMLSIYIAYDSIYIDMHRIYHIAYDSYWYVSNHIDIHIGMSESYAI